MTIAAQIMPTAIIIAPLPKPLGTVTAFTSSLGSIKNQSLYLTARISTAHITDRWRNCPIRISLLGRVIIFRPIIVKFNVTASFGVYYVFKLKFTVS